MPRRAVLPRPDPTNVATEVKYRGVRKNQSGRYTVEIYDSKKKKNIWVGTFSTAVEAAHAYDAAARELRGDKAKLNFPIPTEIKFPILAELANNNNLVVRNPSQGSTLEFPYLPMLDLTLATPDATAVVSSLAIVEANAAVRVLDPNLVDLDLNAPPPSENTNS